MQTMMLPEFHPHSMLVAGLLIFFGVILPAIIIWFDEGMYVDEIEKEQHDHTAHGPVL